MKETQQTLERLRSILSPQDIELVAATVGGHTWEDVQDACLKDKSGKSRKAVNAWCESVGVQAKVS